MASNPSIQKGKTRGGVVAIDRSRESAPDRRPPPANLRCSVADKSFHHPPSKERCQFWSPIHARTKTSSLPLHLPTTAAAARATPLSWRRVSLFDARRRRPNPPTAATQPRGSGSYRSSRACRAKTRSAGRSARRRSSRCPRASCSTRTAPTSSSTLRTCAKEKAYATRAAARSIAARRTSR